MPSPHPLVEEYLETVAYLIEERVEPLQARLAERLGYSPQAVSEAVVRLIADGFLTRERRRLQLTASGSEIAQSVIRRHRLAERLLVDVIGIPWSHAHDEAGRYEHVISDQVEERLVILLGDPATCPHGNPIPGSGHDAPLRHELFNVASFEVGQHLRIERIPEAVEDEPETLEFLERIGLLPGTVGTVESNDLRGELVILVVAGRRITIGRGLARRLFAIRVVGNADGDDPVAAETAPPESITSTTGRGGSGTSNDPERRVPTGKRLTA